MSLLGRIARQGGLLATLAGQALLVVLFGMASFVAAADWPEWRQNTTHTASHDEPVTLPLVPGWSVDDYRFFSPAIANGVVYLPRTMGGVPTPGAGLGAYRLSNGQLLWERTDLATWGSAAVDDASVVVGGSKLYVLDTVTGATRWEYDETGGDVIFEYPTIANEVVYTWKRNFGIVAFDLSNGSLIWSANLGGPTTVSAPIATGGSIYAIGNLPSALSGTIWHLDSSTGALRWKTHLQYFMNGGLLVNDTIVAAGPVRTFGVEATSGAVRWFRNLSAVGMPVARGEEVWLLYEHQWSQYNIEARVTKFDPANGPPPGNPVGALVPGRARGAQPILAGNQFVYPSEDGSIHIHDADNVSQELARYQGEPAWTPELAAADGKLVSWGGPGKRLFTFGTSVGGPPPEEKEPILLVPGITASYQATVLENIPDPDFHPITDWRFFLIARLYYRQLINGLEEAGLTEGEDFFIAHYDWRLSTSEAAERYLEEWIDHAKQVSGKSKVDIVAHSYGGLVSRAYIQSDRYINDVDQLIMIGTPNQGSAKAYTVWEGGIIPPDKGWKYMDYYIWLLSRSNGIEKFEYIRNHIRSVRDLLPTTDHVIDLSTRLYIPWIKLIEKNTNLADLNSDLPTLLERVEAAIGAGRDPAHQTIQDINVPYQGYNFDGLHWPDGEPDANNPYVRTTEGDGTVLITSALINDGKLLPTLEGVHAGLVNKFADYILLELGYSAGSDPIPIPLQTVNFVFASPLTVRITDPLGRTVNTASAENNIPDAEFIQEDWIKMVEIPNPVPGQYQIELTGTGNGEFHGLVSFLDDSQELVTEDEIAPGFITDGQVITYQAQVPEEATEGIELAPADTTPPQTSSTLDGISGNDGWYRSPVEVTLTATDETGVWKTEYKNRDQEWQLYTEPFVVSNEGVSIVEFRSTDQVGSVEEVKSLEIKIDTIAPVLSFDPALETNYLHNQTIESSIVADDDTSGMAGIDLLLDGESASFPIDLFFLKVGDHQLVARGQDVAGNSAEITHPFQLGATIISTISDLNRVWSQRWISRLSTYLKLRVDLGLAEWFRNAWWIPEAPREELVKKFLEKFLTDLGKESSYLTTQAYQILYDDGIYLLEHL